MKFACDRCKTKYSIAEERVRGKILKIRCKACANVITVKEGMDAPADGERAHRTTTLAPQTTVGSGATAPTAPAPAVFGGALGAAFATVMTAPPAPPQLEDEWYLSRDGEQRGPFGLGNAQSWVSQQPYDAELYCWCEGFDDWLPVDRIAHFRGLRPRPLPPALPQPPASAPLPSLTARAPARPSAGDALPSLASPPSLASEGSRDAKAGKALARGAEAAPLSSAAAVDDKPRFAATMAAMEAGPRPPGVGSVSPRSLSGVSGVPGPSSGSSAGRSAVAAAPIRPQRAGGASPAASPARAHDPFSDPFDAGDLGTQGFGPGASSSDLFGSRAGAAELASLSDDSADLEFSEVSRVVRIADLDKSPHPPARMGVASPRSPLESSSATGARRAGPGGGPATGARAQIGAAAALDSSPATEAATSRGARPPVAQRHHAWILGLAAFALIGGGAGFFVLRGGTEVEAPPLAISGGDVSDLTIRPDDVRRGIGRNHAVADPASGSATAAIVRPTAKRPTGTGNGGAVTPAGENGPAVSSGGKIEIAPTSAALTALGGDEVEAMSQRNSSGLQRCYEQALKKDIFLEVKSIKITIAIDANGVVSNVGMSSHGDHVLGQCMTTRIRNWRFRANTRGLDAKFTVAFGRT